MASVLFTVALLLALAGLIFVVLGCIPATSITRIGPPGNPEMLREHRAYIISGGRIVQGLALIALAGILALTTWIAFR